MSRFSYLYDDDSANVTVQDLAPHLTLIWE